MTSEVSTFDQYLFKEIMGLPWGLAKFAFCPIVIPSDEGEGVGPNDAGDGALNAPLGEFAACKVPKYNIQITGNCFL